MSRVEVGTGAREAAPHGDARKARPAAAPRIGRKLLALVLAPVAALAAAVAGLLFVLLLPICGVASIAQATAEASWAIVREAFGRARSRAPRRRRSPL